ncbi:MAG: hypothetical protein II562_00085 [Prevotella sp.]|nr:hypothetical protein [Prevotella sp.]
MALDEKTVKLFTTRVRQMMLHYQELKKQNEAQAEEPRQWQKKVETLEQQLQQAQNDYNSLKMAKMIEITDDDMAKAKVRLTKLIRDVNRCITMLSEN